MSYDRQRFGRSLDVELSNLNAVKLYSKERTIGGATENPRRSIRERKADEKWECRGVKVWLTEQIMSYPFFLGRGRHPAAYRLVVDDHVDYTDDLRRHQTIRISQSVYIVIRLVSDVDRTLRSRSFDRVQIHTRLNRRCAIRNQQNSHVPDDHTRSRARCSPPRTTRAPTKKRKRKNNEHTDTHAPIHAIDVRTFLFPFGTFKRQFLRPFAMLPDNFLLSIIGDRVGDASSSQP